MRRLERAMRAGRVSASGICNVEAGALHDALIMPTLEGGEGAGEIVGVHQTRIFG